MLEPNNEFNWRVIGRSVRGASHIRKNLPNQDAIKLIPWQSESQTPHLILAVSDGHGSAKCFRSDVGSDIATTTAITVLKDFAQTLGETSDDEMTHQQVQQITQQLVRVWGRNVTSHWRANPFLEEEFASLSPRDAEAIKSSPLVAYGATLLAVLVAMRHVIYLQLGDGDILCVGPQRNVYRPIPHDSRLIANETTSLCTPNAAGEMRWKIERVAQDTAPAMILVSTDGYSNSFENEASFQKIGTDYLDMSINARMSDVDDQLERILNDTSQNGSGDDITLGIIKSTARDMETSIAVNSSDIEKLKAAMYKVDAEFSDRIRSLEQRHSDAISAIRDEMSAIRARSDLEKSDRGAKSDELKRLKLMFFLNLALLLITFMIAGYVLSLAMSQKSMPQTRGNTVVGAVASPPTVAEQKRPAPGPAQNGAATGPSPGTGEPNGLSTK